MIGIDYDPFLDLASERLGERHGSRFTTLDEDLATPEWERLLPDGVAYIFVSSTALHWLEPTQLVALYGMLGRVIPEGDIFMNADHLRYDPSVQPVLTDLAAEDDERTQSAAHARGVPTWDRVDKSPRSPHPCVAKG